MKTHQQALDIADDYDNLSDKIQAYIKARGLVAVPEADPSDEVLLRAIQRFKAFGSPMNGMSNAWRTMLAAAPNPFEGEE